MEHQSIGEFHHSFLLVFLQDEARYLETDDFILNHLAQASDFFGVHDLVPQKFFFVRPSSQTERSRSFRSNAIGAV